MYRYAISTFNFFIYVTILLSKITHAQSPDKDTTSIQSAAGATAAPPLPSHASSEVIEISGTTTTFRPIFTVPTEADVGAPLLPNIADPNATDAQTACPGYNATNVKRTAYGLTATLNLAGPACNVYGTDIATLNLTVEYQSADRLSVRVAPAYIDASNSSQYILPTELVHQPTIDPDAESSTLTSGLSFVWSNDPTFSFSVFRKSTGDTLFSTEGTKLVYENQFIEFASVLPENYNLYGLGETIHGLRLGNSRFSHFKTMAILFAYYIEAKIAICSNLVSLKILCNPCENADVENLDFTKTMWAADIGDPIDYNIYGSEPFYLDTRYYEVDSTTGNLTLVTSNETSSTADYVGYSHGVYNRNAHGQEILLRATNIT